MTSTEPLMVARDLLAYITASPTPFHAVAESARRLTAAGFTALPIDGAWTRPAARGFVVRDGALIAWDAPPDSPLVMPFRIIGAHTDSPNLRIRPQPDIASAGWRQLGIEVYGGALVNSWLDRDLGIAGRVAVKRKAPGSGVEQRLMRIDRPILRVPQLAIHLDRDISEKGLQLNRQQHLTPVWSTGSVDPGGFRRFLAGDLGVAEDDVLAWDVMAFDVAPGAMVGLHDELIASARLDNLCSCFAGLEALASRPGESPTIGVLSLFDHEEVGSESAAGAGGDLLAQVLERLTLARGGDRQGFLAALSRSQCASADMAHATHPNYTERHEPSHPVFVNAGPVVKVNVNQRYATDAGTQAGFELACAEAGVPVQRFVSRNDMPCGSTIGPKTAAHLGVPTVDVGVAQLAMHSIRELCGSSDPALFVRALRCWLG